MLSSPFSLKFLQRFAESARARLRRLGRERRSTARKLTREAAVISREAATLTRQQHPRLAAAARAEAADLRAKAARQRELAARYSAELAELRAKRARAKARKIRREVPDRKERRELARKLGLKGIALRLALAPPSKKRNSQLAAALNRAKIPELSARQYHTLFGRERR